MNQVLVKNEIDKLTNNILNELETFANIKGMEDVFGNQRGKIGRTQLNSLLQNAQNASSVEELKLFISYKESKGNGWEIKKEGKSVAKHLIDSIEKVEKLASNVRKSVDEKTLDHEKITDDDMRKIKLMMVEKFLGYLYWKGTTMAS